MADTATDAAGRFTLPLDALAQGETFQLLFIDFGSGYGPGQRSASFTRGAGDMTVDFRLKPWTLKISNVAWDQAAICVGGSGKLQLTVSNTSGKSIAIDAWLEVQAAPTGSLLGWSNFQRGPEGKPQPMRLRMAQRESATLTLPFAVPQGTLSGSSGDLTVFLSAAGQPTVTDGRYENLYYEITPRGAASMLAGDAAKAQLLQKAQRDRSALLHTRPPKRPWCSERLVTSLRPGGSPRSGRQDGSARLVQRWAPVPGVRHR